MDHQPQVADLIIIDSVALLEESINQLSDTGTIWLFYELQDLYSVLKIIENDNRIQNNYKNATVFTINYKTYQAFHITKSNNFVFNSIEIKRTVLVPYTVEKGDGTREKRGWDYEDGIPKRWTGLGICIYLSDKKFLPQVLSMLSSKEGDVVLYNKNIIKRDYDLLEGKLSTSEDCKLSVYNRKFLPKYKK